MIRGIRYVGFYIDNYENILPSDEALGSIASAPWYVFIKPLFNDYVWNNFYSRELFDNPRFTRDDPEEILANIVKTILIHFKSKNRIYDRMFDAYMKDFNPLWNVDGVVGEIRETMHTGTDTDKKTGADTLNMTGTDTLTKAGKEALTKSGKETNTRNGKREVEYQGAEVDVTSNTTFNDDTFRLANKVERGYTSEAGHERKDTETYTNLKDEVEFTNRKDETTFTDRSDTETRAMVDTQNYNSQNQKTLNLKDSDLFMQIRQGNIGVTRSDELINKALELYGSELYDFVHYVVNDTLNQISYCIY